jgi:DNA-binding transcriptional LysR family regulator
VLGSEPPRAIGQISHNLFSYLEQSNKPSNSANAVKQSEQLRVFLRVAELGSFTAAAASLGLPKANVSMAIQSLETELGVQLFHRTTRSVRLTSDGQSALEKAKPLVVGLDELVQLFHRDNTVRGLLRVDLPTSIGADIVLPSLPQFLQRHPKLSVELSTTDRLVDVVAEGFDCVLRVGTLGDSSLVARSVGKYHVINCVSRGYAQTYGVPRSLSELGQHRLVHYASRFGGVPAGFEYVDPQTGQERTLPMAGVLTVNSVAAYRSAAESGFGIAQLPEASIRDRIFDGSFVEVLSEFRPAPWPVTFLYPDRRHVPMRVRLFMDWVVALLESRLIRRH